MHRRHEVGPRTARPATESAPAREGEGGAHFLALGGDVRAGIGAVGEQALDLVEVARVGGGVQRRPLARAVDVGGEGWLAVEQAGRAGDMENLPALVAELAVTFDTVTDHLGALSEEEGA